MLKNLWKNVILWLAYYPSWCKCWRQAKQNGPLILSCCLRQIQCMQKMHVCHSRFFTDVHKKKCYAKGDSKVRENVIFVPWWGTYKDSSLIINEMLIRFQLLVMFDLGKENLIYYALPSLTIHGQGRRTQVEHVFVELMQDLF